MIAKIKDEDIVAEVVKLMAHGVIVRYLDGGMEYEVMLDKDDVILYDDDEGVED